MSNAQLKHCISGTSPKATDEGARVGRLRYLREVSLFQDLRSNDLALAAIADLMQERSYAPGTRIIEEGTQNSEMYFLISGSASVFKNTPEGEPFKVAIIEASLASTERAFFGESSLIDDEMRSATLLSETECHCLVLTRQSFEQLSREHPQWALPLFRSLTSLVLSRLRKTNTDLSLLYRALISEIRG
ncbi:MAG: cyclic nucleotide-binding domain-containing protein [Methylotenera sp.]|nr:cyclic nucleotide-binding domain-containing protein [Oligoflexia bacterium]